MASIHVDDISCDGIKSDGSTFKTNRTSTGSLPPFKFQEQHLSIHQHDTSTAPLQRRPGTGNNVAATFAAHGSIDHVVLLSRTADRLQNEGAPFVQNAAPKAKVDTLRADLSDLDSIPQVLCQLDDLTAGEDIEVVYYNAARIKPSDLVLSVDAKELEEDFRLQVLALHLLTQPSIPALNNQPQPPPPSSPLY